MELIVTSDNPAPPGGVCSNVRTSDRIVLRVARWHPEGQARGTVVLAQGRAEFIEKYFETVAELLARGFAVVTFDWRGQGLIPPAHPSCCSRRGAAHLLSRASCFCRL
jgi:lysophospholipase